MFSSEFNNLSIELRGKDLKSQSNLILNLQSLSYDIWIDNEITDQKISYSRKNDKKMHRVLSNAEFL